MFGSVLSFQEGKLNMSFAFLDDEAWNGSFPYLFFPWMSEDEE